MKLVEFTRDMRPHKAGETRVVPDDVAQRLIAEGDALPRSSVFDEQPAAKPAPARRYLTRKRGS